MTTPDINGRTVMVTGASRGLGRALAGSFAEAGARLVLCARSRDPLAGLADSLAASGADVEWAAADVRDEAAVGDLVARSEARFGVVDTLVANASLLGRRGPLRDQPAEEWRDVLEVNLTGVLITIRAVLPGMRRAGRGSIITLTSGVGDRPREDWGAYAVSKRAVEALTSNLALEEAEAGVRVNMVDPGTIRTSMRHAAYPDEDPATQTPPADVTPVFLWLASDASAGVTGRRFRAQEWP